jgi:hypothetical protein
MICTAFVSCLHFKLQAKYTLNQDFKLDFDYPRL